MYPFIGFLWEADKQHLSTVLLSNAFPGHEWDRPKPGAWNSTQVPHMGDRAALHEPSPWCPAGSWSQETQPGTPSQLLWKQNHCLQSKTECLTYFKSFLKIYHCFLIVSKADILTLRTNGLIFYGHFFLSYLFKLSLTRREHLNQVPEVPVSYLFPFPYLFLLFAFSFI